MGEAGRMPAVGDQLRMAGGQFSNSPEPAMRDGCVGVARVTRSRGGLASTDPGYLDQTDTVRVMAGVEFLAQDRRLSSPRRRDVVVPNGLHQHRPSIIVRGLIAVLALAACAFAAALMISDRAPALLVDVFGDTVRQLWDRVDASQRARSVTEAPLPGKDFVVHVAVWASITGLVALAIWTWRGLVAAIFGVFGLSVVIELAQGRVSSTRSVESADVVANGVGVAVGATSAAVVLVGWSLIASGIDALRRD